MTIRSLAEIARDFDRIADLSPGDSENNLRYHELLLRSAPTRLVSALDVGCGSGALLQRLGERSSHTVGIDLSSTMIEKAKARCYGQRDIEFRVGDFLNEDFRDERFDCIASIAALHHVEFEPALHKLKSLLKPGGVLLVIDLLRDESIIDWIYTGMGAVLQTARRIATMRLRSHSRVLKSAWDAHCQHDRYLSFTEVKEKASAILPCVQIRRLLYFRYFLQWTSPEISPAAFSF